MEHNSERTTMCLNILPSHPTDIMITINEDGRVEGQHGGVLREHVPGHAAVPQLRVRAGQATVCVSGVWIDIVRMVRFRCHSFSKTPLR